MRSSIHALKSRRRTQPRIDVLEDRQLLSTITVNTTADETAADSTMSLREAIELSDGTLSVSALSTQEKAQVSGAVGSTNTIDFNIPTTDPGHNATTGVWTIAVNSDLPVISTNAAVIDGYSQPGAAKNTLAQGDNAKLAIALAAGGSFGVRLAQSGSQLFGLDIENFAQSGVLITAPGNVQVAGCFIGTDASGEVAAGDGTGVAIDSSSNTIGGPGVGDRNVISGNSYYGVNVPAGAENFLNITPTGNLVENNIIGLDAAGTKALGNHEEGVVDNGSGDIYGGTAPGTGNVISGNGNSGLTATGSVTIQGNYCGTDATGNVAIGNGTSGEGISDLGVTSTTISTVITNNLVSGNYIGIEVSSDSQDVAVSQASESPSSFTISGNLIGTNAAGTAALGNTEYGLYLFVAETATVVNNVISGNGTGVFDENIQNWATTLFQGNKIGTDRTGQAPIGNTGAGISQLNSSNVTIGGTAAGQGNVIAYNGSYGIRAGGSTSDLFTRNSIFDNAKAGILANSAVVPPVLSFTPNAGSTGTLDGTLAESPNASYVVEIFSDPTQPLPGQEQGKTFLEDGDGHDRRFGKWHVLVDRTRRRILHGRCDLPLQWHVEFLKRGRFGGAGGLADCCLIVGQSIDRRSFGDLHGRGDRAVLPGNTDGNSHLYHRRPGTDARDPRARRRQRPSPLHHLDAIRRTAHDLRFL